MSDQTSSSAAAHRHYCSQPRSSTKPLPADLGAGRAFAIRRSYNKWTNRTVLRYCFVVREDWDWPNDQKAVVHQAFGIWKAAGLGLDFSEVAKESEAEILIGRLQDNRSWSWVGTEILTNRDRGRNMNFGWDLTTPWGHATALHEIGHALGLEHEHQNPLAGIVWNEEAVYDYHLGNDGWDRQTTYQNIIAKLPANTVAGSNWDPTSIMHYPFDPGMIIRPQPYDQTGVRENLTLSVTDITWARSWYAANAAPASPLAPMTLERLPAVAGAQRDFVIEPDATRNYTIQTVGLADTRLVLFEERDGEPRHLAAADDAGTDANASITTKLVYGRRYFLRARVHYAEGADPIGVVIR